MLFVGAGFSSGAHRRTKTGALEVIPSGRELISLLQQKLAEDTNNLEELSGIYEEDFGEHGLFSLLTELYVASEITDYHSTICKFKWKEIYTTNYDNVIELSLEKSGLQHSIYTPSKRPADVDYRTLPVIHINGFIPGVIFADFKNEITLTDVKYMSDDFSRSTWGERFRSDIITSPCIIFLGYSLFDIDIARILKSFDGMSERIFFVVKNTPSRSLNRKLSKFGSVVPIGTEGFASIISGIFALPEQSTTPHFSGWEKTTISNSTPKALRDIDVVDFLMSGNIDSDLLAHDIVKNNNNIIIRRGSADDIVNGILSERLKYCILTSNIGNGKTTLITEISVRLASRNYNVYIAKSNSSILLKEIPLFKLLKGPLVIIVDDAFSNMDVLRATIALGRSDLHIVTSARTAQFELQESDIKKLFNDQVENFDLNNLNDYESEQLINYFDKYALWGKRQALSTEQKEHFVRVECSNELRFVILEALDSPNISSRIKKLMEFKGTPNECDRIQSSVIVSQVLNLAQIRSELNLISEMLGFDSRKAILQHEKTLRDFAMVRNGAITIRSSIFSQYVITKIFDTAYVIDTLLRCMQNLDIIFENDVKYADVFRSLSRFRFVETAIASEKRLVHMINYFEKIKELEHCRANPLFWLQYTMCRLSLSQYREAERLFDVAYSYSKMKGYKENRHLNNQYARFLLESRFNSNEYTDYMAAFNKAHNICVKQMNSEPHSYNPYRVAQNYAEFLERRIAEFKVGDLINIARSCAEIGILIQRNEKFISNKKVVDGCRKAMLKTVTIIRSKLKEYNIDL